MVKKIFILAGLLIGCIPMCVAQSYSVDALKHGVWHQDMSYKTEKENCIFKDSFLIETYSVFFRGKWTSASVQNFYYLSKRKPKKFDFSKIGKKTKGKYFNRWNHKLNEFYTYKIDSLSDSILVMSNENITLSYKNRKE